MPEHEIFDLDAAFARLEHDVTTLSSAPGAGAAVARARRRRRTTIAAVAAVTVLAVGGAAIAQGLVRHDPRTITPSSSLPAPAPLTAAAMTGATEGWTPAWTKESPQNAQLAPGPTERCLNQSPELAHAAGPTRGSGNLFFAAGQASALALLFDVEGQQAEADGLWASLTGALDQCDTASPASERLWDGGEARSFAVVSAGGRTEHAWVAHEGTTVGLLWVSDAPAEVPPSADDGVAQAMMAALLDPDSYRDLGSGSVESSSSEATILLSEADFAEALGDWRSGWSATSAAGPDADSAPCGTDPSSGAASGSGQSLGANGEQGTSEFRSEADARSALQSTSDALAACTSTSYDVHTVPLRGGSVTVAAATGAGNDVVWLVQDGRQIVSVLIPAGDTAPPDSVSAKVGDLLLFDLHANADAAASDSSKVGPVESSATAPTP